MKKLCLIFCLFSAVSYGQSDDYALTYTTSGLELIGSFASMEQNGASVSSSFRFAPIINVHSMVHFDFSESLGMYSGFALRNVGYRTKEYVNPADGLTYEKAFRSYNLGIPVGFKFGKVKEMFFYAGYEIELGVLYKEKTYESNDKIDKITGWFSDRQNTWQSGLMAGIQFPYGANIRFKYYLTEFHNNNYVASGGVMPYANLHSNVWYISLTFFVLRNATVYYKSSSL